MIVHCRKNNNGPDGHMAFTQRRINVDARHDVASTLKQSCLNVACPLGNFGLIVR